MKCKIFQINIKPNTINERGIPKVEVDNVFVSQNGVHGDFNNFRANKKKNDINMAVLLLDKKVIDDLNDEGWPVSPGDLGENITTAGLNQNELYPGNKIKIGNAIIEISFICEPCSTLSILPYIGSEKIKIFIKTLVQRRGWYAKVLVPGQIRKNDLISIID